MKQFFFIACFSIIAGVQSQTYDFGAVQALTMIQSKTGHITISDSNVVISMKGDTSELRQTYKIISRDGNELKLESGNTLQIINKKGRANNYKYNTVFELILVSGSGRIGFYYFSMYKVKD